MDQKEDAKGLTGEQASEQSPKESAAQEKKESKEVASKESEKQASKESGEKKQTETPEEDFKETIYISESARRLGEALSSDTTAQKRKLRAKRRRRFRLIVVITEAVIALILIVAGILVTHFASQLRKQRETEPETVIASLPESTSSPEASDPESTLDTEGEEKSGEDRSEEETIPPPVIEEDPIPSVVAEEAGLYLVALPKDDPDQAFLLYSSADDYLYPHSVTPDQDITIKLYNFTDEDVAFTMILEGLTRKEEPKKDSEDDPNGEGQTGEDQTGEGQNGDNPNGEGQNPEGQPGENPNGEGQNPEGQPGENPNGEGQNGEGQTGENQNGEGQNGENETVEETELEPILVAGMARAKEPGFFHLGSGYEGRVVPSLFYRGQAGAGREYHAAISTGESFRLLTEELYPLMKPEAAAQVRKIYGYQGNDAGENPEVDRLILSLSGSFEEYRELLCRLPYETDLIWSRSAPSMDQIVSVAYLETYNGESTEERSLGGHSEAYITAASLEAGTNTGVGLAQTVTFTLTGNTLEASIPFRSTDHCLTNLVPSVQAEGAASLTFEGEGRHEDGTLDMTRPVTAVLTDAAGARRTYAIKVRRMPHNLPIIHLYTDNGAGIVTRDYYTAGTFSMEADHVDGVDSVAPCRMSLRGRGHSSWDRWPKKAFKVKFDSAVSLFGLEKDKDWVFQSNYYDRTLSRNYVAFELARLMNMRFVPHSEPVDVFLNGEYIGVYGCGEQVEVAKGRVSLAENPGANDAGFLLEVGGSWDGVRFSLDSLPNVEIHYPEQATDAQRTYIANYLTAADNAIKNKSGYEEYIDVDSFIDWLIITEFCYNWDAAFKRNVYMVKDAGGKLRFEPVWDYDLAFGSVGWNDTTYQSWATTWNGMVETTWTTYLIEDPAFMARLKARWLEVRDPLMQRADEVTAYLTGYMDPSFRENHDVWMTEWDGVNISWEWIFEYQHTTLAGYFEYLQSILDYRYSFMNRVIVDGYVAPKLPPHKDPEPYEDEEDEDDEDEDEEGKDDKKEDKKEKKDEKEKEE